MNNLLFTMIINKKIKLRFFLFLFFLLLFGNANLNINKSSGEESIGGYSVMDDLMPVPLFLSKYFQHYDEILTKVIESHNFNGNVLIAKHGIIIYNKSFGYSDFNDNSELADSTIFQIASIGKTITASAVLLLKQEGLLELNDYVVKHIPEFPYPNITVRHLLNHTSGLQNYMWLIENRWNKEEKPDNEDVLDLFNRHTLPLNFHPGSRFDYSNTGYAFLALVVERVSGESFADFIENNIFEPLNMQYSFVRTQSRINEEQNLAFGHRRFRNTHIRIPENYIDGVVGDKGIYSSAVDLFKWDQALYKNSIINEELTEQAFDYAVLNNSRTVNYGYGWRLKTFMDKKVAYHPGRWSGYRTFFKRFIEDNTTIIVLNNTNKNINRLVEEIQLTVFYNEMDKYANMKDSENLTKTDKVKN